MLCDGFCNDVVDLCLMNGLNSILNSKFMKIKKRLNLIVDREARLALRSTVVYKFISLWVYKLIGRPVSLRDQLINSSTDQPL